MALYLYTGNPGSGKSYFMVRKVLKDYCDEVAPGSYMVKKEIVLVSNIEELKLFHEELDQWLKDAGGVEQLFNYEQQEAIVDCLAQEGKRLVYLIDECHEYFPAGIKSQILFNFFRRHRHLGLDFHLTTQDRTNIPKQIYPLAESEIRAAPRSTTPFFKHYNVIVNGIRVGSKKVRPSKTVYRHYQSMKLPEVDKQRVPYLMHMGLAACLFLVSGYFFLNSSIMKSARGVDKETPIVTEAHAATSSPAPRAKNPTPPQQAALPAPELPTPQSNPEKRTVSLNYAYTKAEGQTRLFVVDPRDNILKHVTALTFPISIERSPISHRIIAVYGVLDAKYFDHTDPRASEEEEGEARAGPERVR